MKAPGIKMNMAMQTKTDVLMEDELKNQPRPKTVLRKQKCENCKTMQ